MAHKRPILTCRRGTTTSDSITDLAYQYLAVTTCGNTWTGASLTYMAHDQL
ncbi:hypothetical protein GCM10009585_18810 [Brevibacterium paucivorans]